MKVIDVSEESENSKVPHIPIKLKFAPENLRQNDYVNRQLHCILVYYRIEYYSLINASTVTDVKKKSFVSVNTVNLFWKSFRDCVSECHVAVLQLA